MKHPRLTAPLTRRPIRAYHWLCVFLSPVLVLMALAYLLNGGKLIAGLLWLVAALVVLGWGLHRTGLIHGRDCCPKWIRGDEQWRR